MLLTHCLAPTITSFAQQPLIGPIGGDKYTTLFRLCIAALTLWDSWVRDLATGKIDEELNNKSDAE